MTIANRISNIRIAQGYSQEDLAKKCGWSSRSSISQIESSGDDISLKKIKKIAKALNTSIEYLMGWDEYNSKYAQDIYIHEKIDRAINKEQKAISRFENAQNKVKRAEAIYKRSEEERKQRKSDIKINEYLETLSIPELNETKAFIDYLLIKKGNASID